MYIYIYIFLSTAYGVLICELDLQIIGMDIDSQMLHYISGLVPHLSDPVNNYIF